MPSATETKIMTKSALPIRQQAGRTHYTFALSGAEAHDLISHELLKVDKWSSSNEDGYQREPIPSRVTKFAKYIQSSEGSSPTSVLLFSRYPERIKSSSRADGTVELRIDLDREHPLYIPDGQHRLFGIKDAVAADPQGSVAKYELPVVLMTAPQDADPRFEEATQFFTINHFSKRVPTDLAERYRLRQLQKNYRKLRSTEILPADATRDKLKPYAVAIVDLLNAGGPWSTLIDLPNSKESTRPISQTAFVESLLPLLQYGAKYGWDLKKATATVSAFWSAVAKRCPEASQHWYGDSCTSESHSTYVLRTTAGVYSLNDVLSWLVGWHTIGADTTNEAVYGKLLSLDPEHFSDTWWMSGEEAPENGAASQGTGRASFNAITNEIRGELNSHLKEI